MPDRWITSLSWEEGTSDGRTVVFGAQRVYDDRWQADEDAKRCRATTGWMGRAGSGPEIEGPTVVGEPWHRNSTPPEPDEAFAHLVRINRVLHDLTVQGEHWHGGPNPCPICGGTAR